MRKLTQKCSTHVALSGNQHNTEPSLSNAYAR